MTSAAVSQENAPAETPRRPTSRRRGLIWFLLLFSIACVVGYAVWRVGRPIAARAATDSTTRGAGGGRGRGGGGLVPVVVSNAARADIPVYLNGLGNATAFYTVTVKSGVDGQLMK